jgi:hypothetical protein
MFIAVFHSVPTRFMPLIAPQINRDPFVTAWSR